MPEALESAVGSLTHVELFIIRVTESARRVEAAATAHFATDRAATGSANQRAGRRGT